MNILKFILKLPRKLEVKMITFYQTKISIHTSKKCKYIPTCSEYTKQAVDKYGIIKGNIIGFFRILRCNPFSKGGMDELK